MSDEVLLELAADIVSAHVRNNSVSADQLPALIQSVYGSLAGLGKVEEAKEEVRTPAVSIRASVKPDGITCLECGKKLKMLKRHLQTDHGLTIEEYRARWNLASSYPVVAAEYTEKRKQLARQFGLGRKPGMTKMKAEPKAIAEEAGAQDAPVEKKAKPRRKAAGPKA